MMKPFILVLCSVLYLVLTADYSNAQMPVWPPSPGHTQIPIWPGTPPDAQPIPDTEKTMQAEESLVGGKAVMEVINVSRPTMTVYAPRGKNTGAAVVVFPGGGYKILAIDLEGTEVCDWLTSRGITCVLPLYRAKTTRHLLFQLDHAQIAFGQIVGLHRQLHPY